MKHTLRFFSLLAFMLTFAAGIQAQDIYEEKNKATNWYADRCENAISLFESTRQNSHSLPQKYVIFKSGQASPLGFAMVVANRDESELVMITPDGNGLKAQRVSSSVLPEEDCYWDDMDQIGIYRTVEKDITLRERPIAVRSADKAANTFEAVTYEGERIKDIRSYNTMIFKPHQNSVKFVKEERDAKYDELQDFYIKDDMLYTFKLRDPSVMSKMFRGYSEEEMCPWIVKSSFFDHHSLLQYSRWKEGEPIKKAGDYVCRIISDYYGGRRITDSRWLATVESGERSFYAVQFEHQPPSALAAVVCVAEGEVVSVWEFPGNVDPETYTPGSSIWFVDDEGNFMDHAPEIHCIVATDEGLELYVRLYGGESVQYYIIREMGPVLMTIHTDYWVYVWD